MLKFLASISFLYLFVIVLLLIYGWLYYRSFAANGSHRKRFPVVFALIAGVCIGFLYVNFHAPLSMKTFSNLDHYFLRHDGFRVNRSIALGRSDTVHYPAAVYNEFQFEKKGSQLNVSSNYSEEPFYSANENTVRILSAHFPARSHSLSFVVDKVNARFSVDNNEQFILQAGDSSFKITRSIRSGITAWNLFKDEAAFINSVFYSNEQLVNCLRNIYLIRGSIVADQKTELQYFISGRIFRFTASLNYDTRVLGPNELAFTSPVTNNELVGWGIGFPENNKNQYRTRLLGADSFLLRNRYPKTYPLTEEKKDDWSEHGVTKFMVSNADDLVEMPSVFREGFLFDETGTDTLSGFSPVLLSYQKSAANQSPALVARFFHRMEQPITPVNKELFLPARTGNAEWIFSIQDSFEWKFGSSTARNWEVWILGSLLFFFFTIFVTSLIRRADELSWIWQLLSCISLVLLTTRFFLYWRYKSFPPYEGLDLPSTQQLNTPWNFQIIIIATGIMSLVFGWTIFSPAFRFIRRFNIRTAVKENWFALIGNRFRFWFIFSWITILLTGCGYAAWNNYQPTATRHLSVLLVLLYFLFSFISYQYSPLVKPAGKSWWSVSTSKISNLVVSNPVKLLLSLSLLAVFLFIDIGFAIIFFNFLLFNEAFLCTNYAIAGLSAGSRKNAWLFGWIGGFYLILFIVNLVYAPQLVDLLLRMPVPFYTILYLVASVLVAWLIMRLFIHQTKTKRLIRGIVAGACLFLVAFFFFPREKVLDKAAMTRYRIDVMTMPVAKAIEKAYDEGKTYEPVIRAAQNQWFINAFIYEKNNPAVNKAGFHLLPHAPQNKGARYNAQATDLVASRFLIAEHGKWSVLLFVLILLVPSTLLASFYKLYPDFTNRINERYPAITTGFSILNYLLITALLVILAATGRYIFFGQDLPFGSILSKQSILFPAILIVLVVLLFKKIPLELYPNRRKLIPGMLVFGGLAGMLFLVKPVYNKEKEFTVTELAKDTDPYIQLRLQPILDYLDTASSTRRLSFSQKDRLFTDSLKKLEEAGILQEAGSFFRKELQAYSQTGFSRHLDQRRLLYLDLYSGRPQLALNENYFRIEPPPHLQQSWAGNVFGDSSNLNITVWNKENGEVELGRIALASAEGEWEMRNGLELHIVSGRIFMLNPFGKDSVRIDNPGQVVIRDSLAKEKFLVRLEPDAFMRNLYVNGNRFYVYPLRDRFIWARNFSESISSEYAARDEQERNAFVSLNAEWTDSIGLKIQTMMRRDTAYKKWAEYGICIADGNGRIMSLSDHILGLDRPDPNNKPAFNDVVRGENGFVSQSLLRKKIGNLNLLRLNPGPGSTLKPIVFSAIASQLYMDWNAFAAEGFSQPQQFYGGEKVAEYDFEKNNGRISNVVDYLRYSDNYYHSNLLLIGSYPKQPLQRLLTEHFSNHYPANNQAGQDNLHWPYFSYKEKEYWLSGFENWPGYENGKSHFGSDSSYISAGLFSNYNIATQSGGKNRERFQSSYDSSLFLGAYKNSGFILPEAAVFDQQGRGIDLHKPNEVFMSCFRGHVKGSSQVMMPPVKMLEAFGKLITQNRNYELTLDPQAKEFTFSSFDMDPSVRYSDYLGIIRENVLEGMKQALYTGTAARLGVMLKNGSPYYYYAKTGTTGDNEEKSKSKLFVIVISKKELTDPSFNFRDNKFYTIYFTSQNGPPKQNEEFQKEVIRYIESTEEFKNYMK